MHCLARAPSGQLLERGHGRRESRTQFLEGRSGENWKELDRHIAGNYISITPSGQRNRTDALDRLHQIQLDDYSVGDFQVELNANTLVVTYTMTAKGKVAGQPFPSLPVRMMSVWQHQKAGWMKIAHTVTQENTQ